MITLKPADTGDLPFLWEMLYEAIHVEPGESKPPREILASGPLAHYVADWGRLGDQALIAEADGRAVGAGWFRLFAAADRGYGYVADDMPELSLAILPGFRGLGIGTLLLDRLLAQAQLDGYRGVSLSVDPRNAAVRLYERAGFAYLHTDAGGSWTMVKRLG
ncbi:MAG TPA: GNAT family N-acetyltransferase [Symbiobacteriaceae bacterium]|nr:GNAT family N-acetyltransferase [Symbiobacteriaceae bacterium]